MSHYEARLERDLEHIRTEITTIATRVQVALRDAVHALLSGNRAQAYDCIQGDLPINRAVRKLDKSCHGFIAVHLPSAGHLRWVSAVMRINTALERIGDYAVTICREAVQLPKSPDGTLAREMELMSKESSQMLEQAMHAFAEQNAEAAKATMIMADQVEREFDTVFEELTGGNGRWTKRDIYALLVIFHELERVSDQAKNICEETVFAVTGEGKAPKTYRVLVLDQDNAGVEQDGGGPRQQGLPGPDGLRQRRARGSGLLRTQHVRARMQSVAGPGGRRRLRPWSRSKGSCRVPRHRQPLPVRSPIIWSGSPFTPWPWSGTSGRPARTRRMRRSAGRRSTGISPCAYAIWCTDARR